jgi:phosphonate transport system substrate-binding protein
MWLAGLLAVSVACDSGETSRTLDFGTRLDERALAERLAGDAQAGEEYVFGFDLRGGIEEDVRQYLPFLRYLSDATGLRFRLHLSDSSSGLIEDLRTGKVQLAAVGAGSYLEAHELMPIEPLVRGLDARGEPTYHAVIVVAPDSPLRSVPELRGRRFAFGSVTSTQGHVIPRIMLLQQGIELGDLGFYDYRGSHGACAEAVISGRFDACGMQDVLARALEREGLVRILEVSDPFPSSCIAASASVPAEVRARLVEALLAFDPTGAQAGVLYRWDRTEMAGGFVEASDGDYAELRRWMQRFGMLPETGGAS